MCVSIMNSSRTFHQISRFCEFTLFSICPVFFFLAASFAQTQSSAANPFHAQGKGPLRWILFLSYGYSHPIFLCFYPGSNCSAYNLACFLLFYLWRPLCFCAVTFTWNIVACLPLYHLSIPYFTWPLVRHLQVSH